MARSHLDPCPVCKKPGTIGVPHFDGHGIFLFYSCGPCHDKKIKGYRSDIYEAYDCDEPIEED